MTGGTMLRSVAVVIAVAASVLAPSSVQAQAPGTAQVPVRSIQRAADSLIVALHERGLFNGAVVLGRAGEEIYARGFGPANVEAGVAFTPDTPADGGSVAKTFTAAAIFMLEAEGRLNLDDRVRQHIPEYPHGATRVRHLLTHTAALPESEYDFFDELIAAGQVRTTSLFLDVLRQHGVEPAFEPGTRFRYSSLGFDVAALLVERVSGQAWESFLRDRFFTQLGMHATFLRPTWLAEWTGVRTLSYRRLDDSLAVHDVFDNEGFYGGSNLYFSARDLHRWSRSFHAPPLLSPAVISRGTQADVLRDPTTGSGGHSAINLLGWYHAGHGRRYHYPGSIQGFWTSVYRDEDLGHSIIYVSNNSIPQRLRPWLTRALIEIMAGRTPAAFEVTDHADIGAEDVDAIIGSYAVEGVGVVTIEGRDGRAFIRVGEGIEYPAFFVGDGQLYLPGLDVWVGFPAAQARPFRRVAWLSIFHGAEGTRLR